MEEESITYEKAMLQKAYEDKKKIYEKLFADEDDDWILLDEYYLMNE